MFKAVINVHNLREISTEPIRLWNGEAETIPELMKHVTANLDSHSPMLSQGFSMTVDISEVK